MVISGAKFEEEKQWQNSKCFKTESLRPLAGVVKCENDRLVSVHLVILSKSCSYPQCPP